MDSLAGTYVLLTHSPERQTIRVGKFGQMRVDKGSYVYVGSAFGNGGIDARLRHHKRIVQAPHWHIDYLRPFVDLKTIWYSHDKNRREHQWAYILETMPGATIPLQGFGASDCKCRAHLFFYTHAPTLNVFRRTIRANFPDHDSVFKYSLMQESMHIDQILAKDV